MIEFKSDNEYYYDEKSGLKNNTIRKIDLNDGRFKSLRDMCLTGNYSKENIKIINSQESNKFFVRQIKHIAMWGDYVIITWRS